jgi:hypothetical protein
MDVQTRKPHAGNAGYVCERKARLGGHIVVYDRDRGFDDLTRITAGSSCTSRARSMSRSRLSARRGTS